MKYITKHKKQKICFYWRRTKIQEKNKKYKNVLNVNFNFIIIFFLSRSVFVSCFIILAIIENYNSNVSSLFLYYNNAYALKYITRHASYCF